MPVFHVELKKATTISSVDFGTEEFFIVEQSMSDALKSVEQTFNDEYKVESIKEVGLSFGEVLNKRGIKTELIAMA